MDLHKNLTTAVGCASKSALGTQFSGKNQFVDYVTKVRRRFVACQGWRVEKLKTILGLNCTGVFRSVADLIVKEIRKPGGVQTIISFKEVATQDGRLFFVCFGL